MTSHRPLLGVQVNTVNGGHDDQGTWQGLMAACALRLEQTLRKGRVTLSAASVGTAAATGLSSGMETGSLILGRGAPTAKSTSMPKGTPPAHARHTLTVTHRF